MKVRILWMTIENSEWASIEKPLQYKLLWANSTAGIMRVHAEWGSRNSDSKALYALNSWRHTTYTISYEQGQYTRVKWWMDLVIVLIK